jgi:hypothetical protein
MLMQALIRLALIGAAMLAPSVATASSTTGGYVTGIYVNDIGAALIDVSGTRTTPPACSTSAFAVSITTATGQAMLAQLLSAMHNKTRVNLVGSTNCSVWPDRETIIQAYTYP